jgi:YspA, cpYpsA-related SLOG family
MIFVVCGGRHFMETGKMIEALDELRAQLTCELLITGGADGADVIADRWGEHLGIPRIIVPANLGPPGEAAAWSRNARTVQMARMVQLARLLADPVMDQTGRGWAMRVIAFPGGKATADMCYQARATGVQVIEPMGEGAYVR